MIIDMRCRLTTPEAGSYFASRSQRSGAYASIRAFAEGTLEGFFREIGEAGITTAVSVSGCGPGGTLGSRKLPDRTTSNDLMARVQRENPGRFVGVAGIDAGNVFHNALDEIERCHQLGLRVVFLEPGRSPGCDMDDRRLYPIYEKCVERDMTLNLHTSGILGGSHVDYADPRHLDRVAGDFLDLRIVAGHGCWPYVREAIAVAARRDNVYLSPDVCLLYPGTEDWVKAVNMNLHGMREKFLFGTAYPLTPLKPYLERFFQLPWSEEAVPNILYRNALRALKLEDDPVFREMYRL